MNAPEFDPAMLEGCEDLPLLARGIVEGLLVGLHRCPYIGYGHEFASYRPYAPGDALRYVDWKVWSRTDEWYVKQFEDETNLLGHVFLDASGSMNFGEGGQNKFRYARLLSAALASLMLVQRDAPGLVIWNAGECNYLPPRKSGQQIELWATLAQGKARGNAALSDDVRNLLTGLVRRGISIVISDFLAEDGEAVELCETLRHHRQEVIAFQVLSPEECDMPLEGNVLLVDNETGEERTVQPEAARASYLAALENHCASVQKRCWDAGVDYHRLRTDEPVEDALRSYLLRREAMPTF
jgi:uncharacterized protein (DUF58 family)